MGNLTKNFSRSEFKCKCGCGDDRISLELVEMLQEARKWSTREARKTVRYSIVSGIRCKAHNASVGSSKNSAHIPAKIVSGGEDEPMGHAVDLRAVTSGPRLYILAGLISVGFNRIGMGKNFIHADIDTRKPQNVLFHYYAIGS